MGWFAKLSIKSKIMFLVAFVAAGIGVLMVGFLLTLQSVRINSGSYDKIESAKDIISDVLPPPMFLVEAYTVSLQMNDTTDATQIRTVDRQGQQAERALRGTPALLDRRRRRVQPEASPAG